MKRLIMIHLLHPNDANSPGACESQGIRLAKAVAILELLALGNVTW